MSARPAFKVTQRQVRALVAITPPGHVAELRIAFVPVANVPSQEKSGENDDCENVFGTGQSG